MIKTIKGLKDIGVKENYRIYRFKDYPYLVIEVEYDMPEKLNDDFEDIFDTVSSAMEISFIVLRGKNFGFPSDEHADCVIIYACKCGSKRKADAESGRHGDYEITCNYNELVDTRKSNGDIVESDGTAITDDEIFKK